MRIARHIAAGLILTSALAAPALADSNQALVLGGTDFSPVSTYTAVGVVASLNGSLDRPGPIVRLWGDRLTYDFTSDGTRVGATSWGHSFSLGYQFKDLGGFESVFTGIDTRSTNLAPFVESPTAGTHTGTRFELDAFRNLTSLTHVSVIGTSSTANREYWTRLEVLSGAPNRLWLGPLVVVQGNPDYHGIRTGLSLEHLLLGQHIGTSIAAGIQKVNGEAGTFTSLNLIMTP